MGQERDDAIKERAKISQRLRFYEQNPARRKEDDIENVIEQRKKERNELTAKINGVSQAIATHKRELNKFNRTDPMVMRQTRGINADFMERMVRQTFGGGSFSAYDIMRGGVERNDVINELQKHTGLLQDMEGHLDTIQSTGGGMD